MIVAEPQRGAVTLGDRGDQTQPQAATFGRAAAFKSIKRTQHILSFRGHDARSGIQHRHRDAGIAPLGRYCDGGAGGGYGKIARRRSMLSAGQSLRES